jgi:hypothetical protein
MSLALAGVVGWCHGCLPATHTGPREGEQLGGQLPEATGLGVAASAVAAGGGGAPLTRRAPLAAPRLGANALLVTGIGCSMRPPSEDQLRRVSMAILHAGNGGLSAARI